MLWQSSDYNAGPFQCDYTNIDMERYFMEILNFLKKVNDERWPLSKA